MDSVELVDRNALGSNDLRYLQETPRQTGAQVSVSDFLFPQSSALLIASRLFVFPLQLGGCGILGVGVWLSVTQGNFATLSSSLPSLSAANLLIAVGTIIMVIGCLGCVGAVKESRPLLLTFFILLLLIFFLEILSIMLFFIYQDEIDHYAQRDLKKGLQLFGTEGNVGLTNAWMIVQTDFRCCGVTNHTDWFEVYNASRVPDSCCLEYSDNCGLNNPGTWWTAVTVLRKRVKDWLNENLVALWIFALCTALTQVNSSCANDLAMIQLLSKLHASVLNPFLHYKVIRSYLQSADDLLHLGSAEVQEALDEIPIDESRGLLGLALRVKGPPGAVES
ncbi:hypothetical protein L3Q82_008599, partial [Scortum barcoo]